MNRTIHRVLGIFAALLLLWIAGTGIGMQVLDLKAILTHESPTDPQELSMQEGMYGPNGFAVIQVSDFSAPALPQDFDINKGIATVLQAANAQQNQRGGSGAGQGDALAAAGSGVGRGARMGGDPNGRPNGARGGGLGAAAGSGPGGQAQAARGDGPAVGPGGGGPGTGGPGGGGGRGQMSSDDRVAAIDQAVKLTGDQKSKIKAVYDANQQKAADLRAAQDPDMRTKLAALRADQNTQIEAVLTAAQKPGYEAYIAGSEPQGRGPGGGGNVLPAAGATGGSNGGQSGQGGPGGGRRGPGGDPSGGGQGTRQAGGPSTTGGGAPGSGQGRGQGAPGGGAGGAAPYNPLAWIELRMDNGIPIGQAMMGTRLVAFNALTGESVTPVPPKSIPQGGALPPSLRQRLKTFHRFWNRQDTPGVYVEFLAGLTLWTLVVSGLVMYFRLWSTRWKQGRPQPFWLTGGGLWRATHRVVSIVASVFLLWMSFTGTWIGFESSYGPIKRVFASKPVVLNPTAAQAAASVQQGQPQGQRSEGGPPSPAQQPGQPGGGGQQGQPGRADGRGQAGGPAGGRGGPRNALDFVLPLRDTEVREMTAVTLNSMRQIHPAVPIKVIRLRTYGQTKQGVVISGGDTTNQYIFNADSGQPASLNEQGYPASGFPFGTQVHENIKHLHSGDYFGIPARLMNLFGGFCLTFLSISGIVVYVDMWLKRRRGGRKSPVWL